MRLLHASTAVVVIAAIAAVACSSTYGENPVAVDADAAPPQQDSSANDDGGGSPLPLAPPPTGCDATADVKDAPACVVNDFGVFVDGSGGNDLNPGTKEKPVKTIANAITKLSSSSPLYTKTRIHICDGTYPEHIKINTMLVSLFGGFACGSWSYSGNKSIIAPADKGKSLDVKAIQGQSFMSDLSFVALEATDPGESSVGVLIETSSVHFLRCSFIAGAGKAGVAGVDGASTTLTSPTSLDGNGGNGNGGGPNKVCTCSNTTISAGGGGGSANAGGLNGTPVYPQPFPSNGMGGLAGAACGSGGQGHDGSNASAAPYTYSIQTTGAIVGAEWIAQPGLDGVAGAPGQGGGGGAGSSLPGLGGGGGACGGCPGLPGKGGKGGGSSIALLSINANLTLTSSIATSGAGGVGGKGGAPGLGLNGGLGGSGSGSACKGGSGGRGSDGGSGGGGAGGASFGVLYKGSAPAIDNATTAAIVTGAPGAKSEGGTKGLNDGPAGDTEKVHAIP